MQQQYLHTTYLHLEKINLVTHPGAGVANSFEVQTLRSFIENYRSQESKIIQSKRYEFFWIKRGAGTLTIDLQQYEIKHQTIFCLMPGQLIQLSNIDDMEGYHISLSPDFIYTIENPYAISFLAGRCNSLNCSMITLQDKELQQELEDIIIKIEKESACTSAIGGEIVKGLFRIFLLYLSRKFSVKNDTQDNIGNTDLSTKFMNLLAVNCTTKKMVIDYASILCVTPGYLNQIVKKNTGYTASYHIKQRLILEAKKQVIHHGKSMKEVAYGLGFDDTAHFSKFFKNVAGSNFTNFKKETIFGNTMH